MQPHTVWCRNRFCQYFSGALLTWVLNTSAQVTPLRYQLCEVEEPPPAVVQRLENNYRYPKTTTRRSFDQFTAHRCENAWVQSWEIFKAIDICPFYISGCSADATNTCNDNFDDWVDYDFYGATLWSNRFTYELNWEKIHI